jgi:hypothetical protein
MICWLIAMWSPAREVGQRRDERGLRGRGWFAEPAFLVEVEGALQNEDAFEQGWRGARDDVSPGATAHGFLGHHDLLDERVHQD